MSDQYAYPARSRLAHPEDVEDLGALPDYLKPAATPAPATPAPASPTRDAAALDERPAGNPVRGLARRKTPPPAVAHVDTTAAAPGGEPPVGENPVRARKEPRDLHRASSANLPTGLVTAVARHREATGMSAGDIVVAAIEKHFDQLPGILAATQEPPPPHSSGFAARGPKAAPVVDNTKLFAYRLVPSDFDYLDQLVNQLGARDRTHLIREALTTYFKD